MSNTADKSVFVPVGIYRQTVRTGEVTLNNMKHALEEEGYHVFSASEQNERNRNVTKLVEKISNLESSVTNERINELEEELDLLRQDYAGVVADRTGLQNGINTVMAMWACDREKLREIQTLVTDSTHSRFGAGGSGLYAGQLQPILDKRYPSGLSAPYGLDHAELVNRIDGLDFKKEWEKKAEKGYQYGFEALQNVKFGFEIAIEALKRK